MGIKEKILQILFPKTCPICGDILEKGREICPECKQRLIYIREPKCKKCGKPFDKREYDSQTREYCGDCTKLPHSYEHGMAVFRYNEEIRESIFRFKYHNQRTYADFYGKEMAKSYGRYIQSLGIEVIIPVPLSKKKRRNRGFNQAELMANICGKQLGIPVDCGKLLRFRDTVPQKELNHIERRKNLKNAFIIEKNDVKYKKILLVDDIYTTGSTIDACAEMLRQDGAEKVYFISLSIGAGI